MAKVEETITVNEGETALTLIDNQTTGFYKAPNNIATLKRDDVDAIILVEMMVVAAQAMTYQKETMINAMEEYVSMHRDTQEDEFSDDSETSED